MNDQRPQSAIADAFDFSFSSFVTPRLIKVLFLIGLVLIAIGALGQIVTGFTVGFGTGLLALVLAPILALVAAIVLRVYLELVMVIFRIEANTANLRRPSTPDVLP